MKRSISMIVSALLALTAFNASAHSANETTAHANLAESDNPAITRTAFDEENVVIRFGVVSDVHQDGYYAGTMSNAQVQEWTHTIDVFQKTAASDGAVLDAILINGDLTDGVAGTHNVGSFVKYGNKATQNMREAGHFAKGVWGADNGVQFTEEKKVIDSTNSPNGYISVNNLYGFGNGFDDTTKLFYVLGNHDELSRGNSASPTKTIDDQSVKFSTIHSAYYFAAVLCGWQHDPDSEESQNNSIGGNGEYQDGVEHSYDEYFADLLDYNTNELTTVTAESFAEKYGVTLASADALFDKYYGHLDFETTLTDKDNGIAFGNSHMTIDPNPGNGTDNDRIHFIGVELSQSNESCAWAEELIKTSVAENPSKPIFIITHYKMPGTMFGDTTSTITRLREVVKNYPQVIIFGGDSHTTMHTENAINSERGFVAVETTSTRYMGTTGSLTLNSKFGAATSNNESYPNTPYNYPSNEAAVSDGCYVEVDRNNNVRINRMDIYRSFSTDYANDTSLYVASKFTNFDNHAYNKDFVAVDKPVFIREPWDITDIGTGKHLDDFNTTTRTLNTEKPYFEDASSIAAESVIGGLNIEMTLNAKDNDGMVMLYVLEVKDKTEKVVHRRYYTNYFYEFPQSDASLAGNDIAVITEKATITDLEPGKYTVSLYAVDDYYVPGEAITTSALALSGKVNVKLDDGRTAVFVDTTGETENYIWKDGIDYLVHNSYESAIATGADVIYVIKSPHVSGSLYTSVIAKQKKALEIIGISENREDTVLSWVNTHNRIASYDLTLTNMALNKEKTGDCGLCITNGRTLTLNDCLAVGDGINIFMGFGDGTQTGNLVINGDTGDVKNVWASSVKSSAATVNGDVNITVTGGNFTSYFPSMKNTNTADLVPNTLNGNLYVNISGGTFSHAVRASIPSYTAVISKNAVFRITGGTMPSIGQAGKSYITGKEVYIVTDAVLATTKYNVSKFPANNNGKSILINVPANEGGIGNATFDSNGIITKFAVKQVAGKESLVNGVAATSITLTEGKTYTVTYKTTNAITFDLNGGEGVVPNDIVGNANKNVTASMPDGDGITRENHTFLGWSTDKNATVPDTSFVISDSIVVVYAVWKENIPVTITLNSNGGTCDKSVLNGFKDENVSLPSASMSGALFAGWSENANASSKDAITELTLTESKTLYAIYISRKPSVDPIITVDYPTFCSGIMNGADTATVTKGCLEDGVNCIKVVPNQSSTQNGDIVLDSYIGIAYPDGFAKGSTLANAKYAAVKYKYVCPDGNGSAQKMGIRILKNGGILEASSSNVYAINSPVNNEWSYVYFDVSDICSNAIEEGVLRQLHIRPFGTGVTPVNTVDGEMFYIGEVTFYEEDPTVIRHYDLTIDYDVEGGVVSTNKESAEAGDDITLTAIPNDGYEIEIVKYNDGINDVLITSIDGVYTFKMPAAPITVKVTFKKNKIPAEFTVGFIRDDGNKPHNVTYDDGTTYSSAAKIVIEKDGTEIYTLSEAPDSEIGEITVSYDFVPGIYTIKVMKPGYLTYTGEIEVTVNGVHNKEIKLIAGDIRDSFDTLYGDGVIDIDDFIRVLRGFASNAEDKILNSVDINEDGIVNVSDLAYVKASIGKSVDNYHE